MLDAVIVGGGPAGAAAAITLARAGRRVLLADATNPGSEQLKIGESLPPATRPVLRELGLLAWLEADGHLPSHGTSSAWGSRRLSARDFIFDPNGHGWHLDRRRFDRSLRLAAARAGANVREGVSVRLQDRVDGGWVFRLGDEDQMRARTLVDASGRRASLARALGAQRARRDRLVGVVGVAPARPDDVDARTLVEAVPDGWWYTALIPCRRRVVSFMTDADLVPADIRTGAGFKAALVRAEHIAPLVARVPIPPRTEPAHGSRLEPPGGDHWLAVGDAALAFDPLSSQGIMTALYTGLVGAQALDASLRGDGGAVDRYHERLVAITAAYEQNLRDAYASEPRWSEHPFWARRQTSTGPGGSSVSRSAARRTSA